MWLSATKGGIMKDAKPEVITVAKYIDAVFYQDGEFEIRFQTIRNRNNGEMIFEFNKFKRIKCCLIQDGFRNKPSEDPYKNYKGFRYMIDLYGKNRDIPAWLKSLALWKFDKPTKTRMVEDQVGRVIFFRKEEY